MNDQTKSQTFTSFQDKWENNRDLAFTETLRPGSDIFNWITRRNGHGTPEQFSDFLKGKKKILDAGCGNGRVTALLQKYASASSQITGIDLTAAHVAKENLLQLPNVKVFPKDLLGDLSGIGTFDFIYCQEVLHHTADPQAAFSNLTQLLEPSGEIAIYVYKLKAPVREFTDEHIRAKLSEMPYQQAMKDMEAVTQLGKLLSDLKIKIEVPEISMLDVKSGQYDLQRFFYHFFMKCFWNPELDFSANVAINYDWYHPQLCSKHTTPEVREWFTKNNLVITHEFVDEYGITMRGKKS